MTEMEKALDDLLKDFHNSVLPMATPRQIEAYEQARQDFLSRFDRVWVPAQEFSKVPCLALWDDGKYTVLQCLEDLHWALKHGTRKIVGLSELPPPPNETRTIL